MNDSLIIQPFSKPVSGSVQLPGSKSITNRTLALAAISGSKVTLEGALFSEDTRIMVDSLQKLGFSVQDDETAKSITIEGRSGTIPNAEAELYVGNAGTAARFLTALLCLRDGGCYDLDGSPAMRERPMRGLLDALEKHGACKVTYKGKDGHFPFTLETKGLSGGYLEVDASASSQILSALLIVAPLAEGEPLIVNILGETVSHPFIDMTLGMMEQFGEDPEIGGHTGPFKFRCGPYTAPGASYQIEPDATAASYFMALPWVVGGELLLPKCGHIELQGDIRFLDVLGQLGGSFDEESGTLQVKYPHRLIDGFTQNFNPISDTFLTLAALSPLLNTELTITGIAHTRKQETDRIAAMATELEKLGQNVTETEDSLTVHPDVEAMIALTKDAPLGIDTYHDHRVAMSFGILGCYDLHGDGRPWLEIHNPACCAKTFPNFFDVLESLRS
ncbi:3-phosphoshikimate 1-carboxyvinyltransferase [Rubellicoccus peritrichatus]|uniref:3-phosphoshikimate 1-carboxyvinyltransferase n=1 Tax=Rubellicoccus peritrichatus TaxID=3080537 RepID=A0AAQ3LFP9_9BACT|nr:3-phosphoshikimate 1-carboxyvinyltransferase [Puniceicoccus sp. CR14]WOO42943.1 3-phosphoshikimate 1-carboxyvinyltransferase [Puniceicoccus sp. CR14]